jgi:CDP-diacylglycerol---glycerol-3-phosphate 3-phosphatidyltransferase
VTSAGGSARLFGLTYARIALVPVVMALVLAADRRAYAAPLAAAIFVVAAVTDFLDGYLARRWGATTVLGSFLDTTADKLLVAGVLIALVAVERASAWAATVIIGRELLIMGLRGLVASEGTVMPPSIWGKLKANVQFAAIVLAILDPGVELGPWSVAVWAMAVASFVTVMSAAEYIARYSRALLGPRR